MRCFGHASTPEIAQADLLSDGAQVGAQVDIAFWRCDTKGRSALDSPAATPWLRVYILGTLKVCDGRGMRWMRTWNVMDARMARVGHRAGAFGMRWMQWLRTCYVLRTQQIPTGNPSGVTAISNVSAHSLDSLLDIMGVACTLYIALTLDQIHDRSVPLHYCKAAQALADLCTCNSFAEVLR
jgi:hypothetical protein